VNLLLVDDDPLILTVARELLDHLGFTVQVAANGLEALGRFRQAPRVDLVILDLDLPDMGGSELVRRFREFAPQTPVLVASGFITLKVEKELKAAGVAALLHKPFRIAELEAQIRKALEGRLEG